MSLRKKEMVSIHMLRLIRHNLLHLILSDEVWSFTPLKWSSTSQCDTAVFIGLWVITSFYKTNTDICPYACIDATHQENTESVVQQSRSVESTRAHLQNQLRSKEADNNRLTVQFRVYCSLLTYSTPIDHIDQWGQAQALPQWNFTPVKLYPSETKRCLCASSGCGEDCHGAEAGDWWLEESDQCCFWKGIAGEGCLEEGDPGSEAEGREVWGGRGEMLRPAEREG